MSHTYDTCVLFKLWVICTIKSMLCYHVKTFSAASLTFGESTYNISENDGHIQPVLILSSPLSTNFTVQVFSSTDDPAVGKYIEHQVSECIIIITFYLVGDDDYDFGPYTVTFPSGVTNASFNVIIIDNDQYESTETFYLIINSFSLPHDMYISHPGHAIVMISDDDCECNM